MNEAYFILSKSKVKEQVDTLENLGFKVSYSYKTNHEVGDVLQEVCPNVDFSIHAKQEIDMIKDKSKISFFLQAESVDELKEIINVGIRTFVVDNEIDLNNILKAAEELDIKINISLRMKCQEHRVGSGKYFVYGMPSGKVNDLVLILSENNFVDRIGVHIHRKSQNTSEWEIKDELEDSLTKEVLEKISFLNFGGGLPAVYRSSSEKVFPYIFSKLKESIEFLKKYNIESVIEPGRFIAAPSEKLIVEIIQVQEKNLIVNTTIYNCALDAVMTETKMLLEEELSEESEGDYYLIKGNSPTKDDIFRYKVKLKNPQVGDTLTFLNAGAYNYTTDFFGFKKLETKILE